MKTKKFNTNFFNKILVFVSVLFAFVAMGGQYNLLSQKGEKHNQPEQGVVNSLTLESNFSNSQYVVVNGQAYEYVKGEEQQAKPTAQPEQTNIVETEQPEQTKNVVEPKPTFIETLSKDENGNIDVTKLTNDQVEQLRADSIEADIEFTHYDNIGQIL